MCACVHACMSVHVCVFVLHYNSTNNRCRKMKFDYIVVYEKPRNNSILCIVEWRSRSRWNFEIFLHLPQYKLSGPITQLVQVRKLILSMYVYLMIIYEIYDYCYAWMIFRFLKSLKLKVYISALDQVKVKFHDNVHLTSINIAMLSDSEEDYIFKHNLYLSHRTC